MTKRQTKSAENAPSLEPARPAPSSSNAMGWKWVTLLSGLYILSMVDRNLLSLLAVDIQADLDIDDLQLGMLYGAAFAVFYALGGLPFGWAIDNFSRRFVLWSGVTLWSFGATGCGLAWSFNSLFMARAVVGSGEAVLIPTSQSILPDFFPSHKLAFPLSIYALAGKIGSGASLLIGGLLTAIIAPSAVYNLILLDLKGWQLIFVAVGIPGFLFASLAYLLQEPQRRDGECDNRANSSYGDYFRFVRSRLKFFLPHHLAVMLVGSVTTGIYSWAPTVFARVHHWTPSKTGIWLGLALALGPVLALPIHGLVCDYVFARGQRRIHLLYLALSLLASMPIGLAAFIVPSPELAIVLIAIFFAIACGYVSLPIVAMQLTAPSNLRGKVASIHLLISGITSMSIGPILVASLTEFVFVDPAKINLSIAVSIAVLFPLSAILFAIASNTIVPLLPPNTDTTPT